MAKTDYCEEASCWFWVLALLCIVGGFIGAMADFPKSHALDLSRVAGGFEWAWRMAVIAVMFHGLVLLKRLAP